MEIYRQITANNIELKQYPFLKELAMEAYLIENEEILKLDNENFSDVTILDAEIALKKGRKTSNRDGRIDILAKYGLDYLAIIELKVNEINHSTLNQLEDYLEAKEGLLKGNTDFWDDNENAPNWVGVLVGTSISPELQRQLQDGYLHNGIPIAGLVIGRYRSSKGEIYVITDTFFKYNYSNRDLSKFRFRGKIYSKSKVVHTALKFFIEKNPELTFAEMEKFFPSSLQGSIGVFATQESAEEIKNRTGHKRHYIKAEELIKLSDSVIATSNQWGKNNINNFIKVYNKLEPENPIENE